jgi:hypothetical protein
MMVDNHPEASLLGLPTELRLKIYEHLILADIDCKIDSNGTQATLIPHSEYELSASVAWLNLPLTCKAIADELRSLVENSSPLKSTPNRTYVMELNVYKVDGRKPIRTATWRRIPCAPTQAQAIIMKVNTSSGPGPWTEGGAASLARALYQLLNYTMHLGPRIFRTALLPEHMVLRELQVDVDVGENCNPPASGCNTDAEINWRLFVGGWRQISRTGFLTGYLETTRLRAKGGEEFEVATEYQKLPALPGYWRGYGFQWGIECAGYRTL